MSRPEPGTRITIRAGTYDDDPWVDGTVELNLSVQFTCVCERRREDGGTVEVVRYAFYRDEGVTWKLL